MSSRFRTSLLLAAALAVMGAGPPERELAICVEPDNLPFADGAGGGFEPEIAALMAQSLHAALTIVPVPQNGHGYVRSTLGRGRCDAIMGVPFGAEGMSTTSPYYAAGWMFVSRADHALHVGSFDDPLLRRLRIGVPAVGEGYDTPPLAALGRRGIAENLKLYPVTGLGGTKSMPAQMIDDLVEERIDLGILWGPSAGYFAARSGVAMTMQPTQASDGPAIPLTMAVSIGVRRGNTGLRDLLDAALAERKEQIARVLAAYHVPAIGE